MVSRFHLGDWEVSPAQGCLQSGAHQVQLEPRVMDLLVYLAEHADEVLSKERLIQVVWSDAFVADDVLTSAIWKLRQALGDNPRHPTYIKTFSRRGYQLVAEVVFPEPAQSTRELDRVTPEEVRPYPGLTPFTADQAKYFFGRETEVEAIWEKLKRSHLVGLIGPSGGGKSSLLRAGVVPSAPAGWGIAITTPGNRPHLSLAQALLPEFLDDPLATAQLLRFEEENVALSVLSNWCGRNQEALLVIDQFEELFTLNPRAEQEKFASLLGQLLEETGVHLLLSMRDDFLFQCHGFDALKPIFGGNLIPIGPPEGSSLKRALVRPAQRHGFCFEDQAIVQEMTESLEGERGTLPMLAFTAAELWKRRDEDRKLLTREAYEAIGGVIGAMAGHAEQTLQRVGLNRVPVVREIFRNLVTSRDTRYGQSRKQLLSVFAVDQQPEAAEVLEVLLNARLLVSYRLPSLGQGGEDQDRIEIVHESLLKHWPRLKRWQTQEAESAQLRDELRQAAHIWDHHHRSVDLLWIGSATREYELWRERYPGRLTDLEEEFGRAMTRHAQARSRRKKLALGAVFLLVLASLIATSTFWRQSEAARLRAEAAHLLALAQPEAERDPTAAVAYATKSLELSDTAVARLFVTDVLTQGPVAFTREIEVDANPRFSRDGSFLILSGWDGYQELLHSGEAASVRFDREGGIPQATHFSIDGRYLWTRRRMGTEFEFQVWRFPELKEVNRFRLEPESFEHSDYEHPDGIFVLTRNDESAQFRAQVFPFEGGGGKQLGIWSFENEEDQLAFQFGEDTTSIIRLVDQELFLATGSFCGPTSPRKLGEIQGTLYWRSFLADGKCFATFETEGDAFADASSDQITIWNLAPTCSESPRTFEYPFAGAWNSWAFDEAGRWLAIATGGDGLAAVWDLTRPVSAGPRALRRGERNTPWVAVHPRGDWVAVSDERAISLWPLRSAYASFIARERFRFSGLALDPRGGFVAVASYGGFNLRLWSLETTGKDEPRTLFKGGPPVQVAVSPDGSRVAVGNMNGGVFVIAVSDGSIAEELRGFQSPIRSLTFAATGTKLAAVAGPQSAEEALIRVWNLEAGDVRILRAGDDSVPARLQFGPDERLFSSGQSGLRSWSDDGTSEVLIPNASARLSPDGRYFLVDPLGNDHGRSSDLEVYDVKTGKRRSLGTEWKNTFDFIWHPSGKAILSTTSDGLIQVGSLKGDPPHRLAGHKGNVLAEFHPNGQWIISAGEDGTIRLWPMPDLSKPAFHTLPYDELLRRLRAMTNYRVAAELDSPAGYRIEYGPFPDWEMGPPEW